MRGHLRACRYDTTDLCVGSGARVVSPRSDSDTVPSKRRSDDMSSRPLVLKMALGLLLLISLGNEATAQEKGESPGFFLEYVRFGAGVTSLEAPRDNFPVRPVLESSLALGFALGATHTVEVSAGYFRFETTEEWPGNPEMPPAEAPYTVSLRAVPVEAMYRHRFSSLSLASLVPVAGLGVTWAFVKDTWQSDTPAQSSSTSLFGGAAVLGLRARVIEGMSVVAQGKYRRTVDPDDRHVQAIGIEGFSAQVGAQISL